MAETSFCIMFTIRWSTAAVTCGCFISFSSSADCFAPHNSQRYFLYVTSESWSDQKTCSPVDQACSVWSASDFWWAFTPAKKGRSKALNPFVNRNPPVWTSLQITHSRWVGQPFLLHLYVYSSNVIFVKISFRLQTLKTNQKLLNSGIIFIDFWKRCFAVESVVL